MALQKTARDRNYQAILPIRGKILNVEKATIDKVLANAEIKTMINAFGCGFSEGYGNDFDITKLRYDKIVIMADAMWMGRIFPHFCYFYSIVYAGSDLRGPCLYCHAPSLQK